MTIKEKVLKEVEQTRFISEDKYSEALIDLTLTEVGKVIDELDSGLKGHYDTKGQFITNLKQKLGIK